MMMMMMIMMMMMMMMMKKKFFYAVFSCICKYWTNHVLSCITGPILQDDVIANFQF